MMAVSILILSAYAFLVVELVFFPIPSEASTFQLFFAGGDEPGTGKVPPENPGKHAAESREESREETREETLGKALAEARARTALDKVLRFFLPTALGVLLFLVPPVAVFVPGIVDHLWPLAALRVTPFVVAGGLLVVAGRLVTFGSVLQLRRWGRDPDSFAARGMFEHSRNPGLVGMYLFYLGNCLLFPCVVLLVGFVPYVVNMHHRVRLEESRLVSTLGPSYRAYLKRVPRYLLFGGGR